MHVADGESDRGGGTIDSGEGGSHGIGPGVATGEVDLVGDIGFAGGFFDNAVDVSAGDGAVGEREALAHGEIVHALGGEAGCGVVVVIDVRTDEDIGLHFTGDGGGSEAADLFMSGDGMKDANVFEGLFGEESGELGDHETAEAVVEVSSVEGVLGEAFADGTVENDGVAGTNAEFFDLFLAVLAVHLELEKEHLGLDSFVAGALCGFGKVNGSHGLDGAPFDDTVVARFVGVLGEEFDLVTDEGAGEEGVAVDPDFPVLPDAADLEADLVGMTDEHDRGALFVARVGVEDNAGVALELLDLPGLGLDLVEEGFEDTVAHRAFQSDGAGGSKDFTHEVELLGGHRLGPGTLFLGG